MKSGFFIDRISKGQAIAIAPIIQNLHNFVLIQMVFDIIVVIGNYFKLENRTPKASNMFVFGMFGFRWLL